MFTRFIGSLAGCLLALSGVRAEEVLNLADAERLAIELDPGTHAFAARADALRLEAVAERQLPDPMLRFGTESVPVDSLALDEEPMTQAVVGFVQNFPPGRTLALRGEQSLAMAGGEEARAEERRLAALRGARRAWHEARYRRQTADTVARTRELFARLAEITESRYASGRDGQQAVLEARVELAQLDDRWDAARADDEAARAELARWIGDAALRPLPEALPSLSTVPPLAALDAQLSVHPMLRIDAADVAAGEKDVALAREAYKPAWAIDVSYGKRFGEEPDGSARGDMFTAMVEMELPLFTGKRQSKRLAASQQRVNAARYALDDRLRELRAELSADYAAWQRLGSRLERYQREVLPATEQNALVTERAYRTGAAEFAAVVRAQMADLESRLEVLRLETERAQAHADIAYFAGETP